MRFKHICFNKHIWETEKDLLDVCKECGAFGTLFYDNTPGSTSYGMFVCSSSTKTSIAGINTGGDSCGFEYMQQNADMGMCPNCNQLNTPARYINDNRKLKAQDLAERESRPAGFGEPEKVTHFRNIGGKNFAVTNKGKIKDIKDTEYKNDPTGAKRAGERQSDGQLTSKAKKFISKKDMD